MEPATSTSIMSSARSVDATSSASGTSFSFFDNGSTATLIGAGRGLDDVREVAAVVLLVVVAEVLTGEGAVLREVVVAAVGDALELAPAPRVHELDVRRAGRIVRQLLG